jgi:hypothetical protein
MSKKRKLTKEQAEKIAQLTSSIFPQGSSWVLKEWDLEKGIEKLTRGLSHKNAKRKLKNWRKERVEELLREERDSAAYLLRSWQQNPSWDSQGIWVFVHNNWYTTKEDAEENLKTLLSSEKIEVDKEYEVYETITDNIPGHFIVV